VGDCCDLPDYGETFDDAFARRLVRRYRRRGLNHTQRRIVDFLAERGIADATVLEIGGGVGELQIELLRRGARQVTNLEISDHYEGSAAALLEQAGLAGRVTRRLHDIAIAPEDVEPADVVVLHRVVCCYPDYERLLAAAGGHARRLLVFSHPPRNVWHRTLFALDNLARRLKGNDFRGFVHSPAAMVAVTTAQGLRPTYSHKGVNWIVVGFER